MIINTCITFIWKTDLSPPDNVYIVTIIAVISILVLKFQPRIILSTVPVASILDATKPV